MEDGLVLRVQNVRTFANAVLIFVVMEDGLVQLIQKRMVSL